jgi:hypothetical protein
MAWRQIYRRIAPISIFLRIIAPFLIFKSPIVACFVVLFLDQVDGSFWYQRSILRSQYNLIDKSLDFLWYSVSLVYAYSNLPFFTLLLLLFLVRTVGQTMFYITKNGRSFIYFPNIYEVVFFFILAGKFLYIPYEYYLAPRFYFALIILSILKIAQEFFIHQSPVTFISKFPEFLRGPDRIK